jgi:putative spermidine/putrescine transport system ATP-binding protein
VSALGVVRDVVYVGAFTRYVVELDAGGELVVLQQNLTMSSMDVLQARGRRVRLFWNRQHSRVIATVGGHQKEEEIG